MTLAPAGARDIALDYRSSINNAYNFDCALAGI